MWDNNGWWWAWGFGFLHMVLYWGVLILGIALLVRWLFGATAGVGRPSDRALEILKERYARGEIGKDEFEQKKRDLTA